MVDFNTIHTSICRQNDEGELADDGSPQNHRKQEAIHENLDELEHFETALTAALSLPWNSLENIPC